MNAWSSHQMPVKKVQRIKTISEFHKLRGLPKPEHPLISVVDYAKIKRPADISETNWVLDFYQVSLKRGIGAKLRYGQQEYDFDEGVMFFISPNQVFGILADKPAKEKPSGWMLLIHPDFIWNSSLAKSMKNYDFFDYSVNEALFVSAKEERTVNGIIGSIEQEYHTNTDAFSQCIILSQIETLLSYCQRYYNRQFLTRKKTNHQVLSRLEEVLNAYFDDKNRTESGLPTVQYLAGQLNMSPKYLSSLLKTWTGQNAQHHIHEKLIEKAKEKLSATSLSVAEIAYALGFEHAQSFSKLFKNKTKISPLEFRQSFRSN